LLTISADLPTLTGEFLDKVVATYEKSGKDALTVLVPVAARVKFGLSVSATDCCEDGLYVSGINMINGAKICEATIPSVTLLTEEAAVLLNINTAEDLEIAKQIITKKT
jgi:GTP:adenosylcobinamide-phosphate guanylyltransferase